MKKLTYSFLVIGLTVCFASCTKDFAELNTNPQIMTEPKPEYLFTYAADALPDGTSAWLYEHLEQYLRWSQLLVTASYEPGSMDMHSRYNNLYGSILPNLFEMRRIIETLPDKDAHMKLWAASYVMQAWATLRVTDVFGSMPYSEAIKARTETYYTPKYDNQEFLFEQIYNELNEAIVILKDGTLPIQAFSPQADIYYNGDWNKWCKLANSLLLRLATRYEGQNRDRAISIFKQVMQDPIGPISSIDEEFRYQRPEHHPMGEIDYRATRYASRNIVDFMKKTDDIRLGMYYAANGLTGSWKDTLSTYGVTAPSFVDYNDPQVQYQGGPANWNHADASWIGVNLIAGTQRYPIISTINRRFFAARLNNILGTVSIIFVNHAEVCFYISEFIQKGYGAGIDTKGTAEDWYKKGVESSLRNMYAISQRAIAFPEMTASELTTSVTNYLNKADVKFDGANNMEKLMIQQYLNFYRDGNEAFAFIRRSGFPKRNSSILKTDDPGENVPRRLWTVEPMQLNRANWEDAMREQGFTMRDYTPHVLSTERLWWDKNNPAYGVGL